MMGSEEAHLLASSRAEMETLSISDDDRPNSISTTDYRSAMSSISETPHPLHPPSTASVNGSDPLLSSASSADNSPKPPPLSEISFIDPPSYADAVFSPPSNGLGFAPRGSSDSNPLSRSDSSSSSSSSSEFIRITVSDPQTEQEKSPNSLVPGGNSYVTYLIATRTNVPEFGASEFSVRRRFRDVVTLADRLSESYRGFLIPPRPDKSLVESQVMQKQEFVDQRRLALEKYLRKLAAHPVIRISEELRVFLRVQGKLPLPATTDVASRMLDGAVKLPRQLFGEGAGGVAAPQEVAQPAKGGRDLLRIFKELKQSMVNDWGGVRPALVEEDREFLEKKDKMQDLEQQLSTSSQQAEALVKAQQDIGETMGELGLAFVKLTKFEIEQAVYYSQKILAGDYRCLATATVKASRLFRELNAHTVKHLDTLHDYLGLMMAVRTAFSDRSSALLTVQTLLSELSTLRSRAQKLEDAASRTFGGDRSRIRKLEELKETVRVTEDAKNCAVREYERIKENNRCELERLDQESHVDFLNMLKGFVINQVGYAEKMADLWKDVAEETSGYSKEEH